MASIDDGGQGVRTHSRMADIIVKGAIVLVTAAVFIASYAQFQVGFWPALVIALSTYLTLLMLHAVRRRSERAESLETEVDRLEDELARVSAGSGQMPRGFGRPAAPARPAPPPVPAARPEPGSDLRSDLRSDSRSESGNDLRAGLRSNLGTPLPGAERAPQMPPPPPGLRAEPAFGSLPPEPAARAPKPPAPPAPPMPAPQAAPAEPTLSPWPDPSAPTESVHDFWSFRPSKAEGGDKKPASAQEPFEPRPKAASTKAPETNESDDDLEAVQGMIKRLAEEVNVGNGGEGAQAAQDTATRVSVNALNTTAGTMRAASSKAAATKAPGLKAPGPQAPGPKAPSANASGTKAPSSLAAVLEGLGVREMKGAAAKGNHPAPPPIPTAHSQLTSVGAALAVQRVNALLDPIVGLADQQVHHYELTVTPVDERGNVIVGGDVERVLRGTGLTPLLDSSRLVRAAYVADAFAAEGRSHQVFVAIKAESLSNDRYLDDLASVYRRNANLAAQLVLTFKQADVAQFGGAEWSAVTDLRDLGFQFALVGVNDLDIELTALRAAGFAYAKIDAGRLNNGLSASGHMMPGHEVCSYLDEMGLTLIVDRIDSEPARAKVVESGVRLGQGPLFGDPLSVPSEPTRGLGTAAA